MLEVVDFAMFPAVGGLKRGAATEKRRIADAIIFDKGFVCVLCGVMFVVDYQDGARSGQPQSLTPHSKPSPSKLHKRDLISHSEIFTLGNFGVLDRRAS
jgi:hypothetical protein